MTDSKEKGMSQSQLDGKGENVPIFKANPSVLFAPPSVWVVVPFWNNWPAISLFGDFEGRFGGFLQRE
jgi:hypothetical protein